jgi:type IV pilus assembly protein PilE
MTKLSQWNCKADTSYCHQSGFTLIELMVVIIIIGIILKIAVPAYTSSVLASHRTDAKTALLDLATREEKFYSVQNKYSATASDLYGYTASTTSGFPDPQSGSTAYYTLTVTASPTSAFQAKAALITAGDACGTFTIDNTGLTGNQDSSSGTAITGISCW